MHLQGLARIAVGVVSGLLTMAPGVQAQSGDSLAAPYALRPIPGNVGGVDSGLAIPLSQNPSLFNPAQASLNDGTGSFFQYKTQFIAGQQHTLYDGLTRSSFDGRYVPFVMEGFVATRDNAGSRVIEYSSINESGTQKEAWNLFAGGAHLFHQESAHQTALLIPLPYAAPRMETGIEHFLIQVKLRGTVGGDAMAELLGQVQAVQAGTDREGVGARARVLIYTIRATESDQARGYNFLRVYVRVGDYRIYRTLLELPWGTERTDYMNVRSGLSFPDGLFMLPGEGSSDLDRMDLTFQM